MKSQHVVWISERALIQRLRRKLARDRCRLFVNRSPVNNVGNVGDYYIVDANNVIIDPDVDLVKRARDTNLLWPWEHAVIGLIRDRVPWPSGSLGQVGQGKAGAA